MSSRMRITERPDGTHTMAVVEHADGSLPVLVPVAGAALTQPWDEQQHTTNEIDLMTHGFDPSLASSPWFAERVREEHP